MRYKDGRRLRCHEGERFVEVGSEGQCVWDGLVSSIVVDWWWMLSLRAANIYYISIYCGED